MAVLGMKGTGSFANDERPQNWRQMILLLFPNGKCPLTGVLSKLAQEGTDDPLFHWLEKGLAVQRGIILGASTTISAEPADGADIAAADATAEVAIKLQPEGGAAEDHTWIKPGHLLLNQNTDEVYLVIRQNGTWIVVRRDIGNKFTSNPAITGDLTNGDPVVICGTGFPEGAPVGEIVSYQPLSHFNYTQIFRTPLALTRTARKTKMRYDKDGPYLEEKREKLHLHGIELEKAFLFSERDVQTSFAATGLIGAMAASTAKPLRTTRGLVNWLPAASSTTTPAIHWNIGASTAFNGGLSEDTFDEWLEILFRYGAMEKLAFAGSTALNVLNRLAKAKFTIQAVPSDEAYGLALTRIITPFGNLLLKQHPLMSADPVWRRDLIVADVAHLKYRYVDDTRFLRNRQSPGEDATIDEFLTEAGLECHFSGATADSGGGLPAEAGPAVHGRLKGVATFIG